MSSSGHKIRFREVEQVHRALTCDIDNLEKEKAELNEKLKLQAKKMMIMVSHITAVHIFSSGH